MDTGHHCCTHLFSCLCSGVLSKIWGGRSRIQLFLQKPSFLTVSGGNTLLLRKGIFLSSSCPPFFLFPSPPCLLCQPGSPPPPLPPPPGLALPRLLLLLPLLPSPRPGWGLWWDLAQSPLSSFLPSSRCGFLPSGLFLLCYAPLLACSFRRGRKCSFPPLDPQLSSSPCTQLCHISSI